MKKIYYILILLILSNCNLNKVNKSHGTVNLNKKMAKLNIYQSNKNDVIKIIGAPSTKSEFDDNKWYFIERRMTNTSMLTLGREKLEVNNVLILEFDSNGILASKKIYDKQKMQELEFSKNSVTVDYQKKNIIYNIMSSVRQKIQAPIKKSLKKKREN
tara:strand:+ start:4688 stop:5161 length:474 start_codon:yes stop_codon:yes gene_type:complete